MTPKIELPPKYYLTHFTEFLSELKSAENLFRSSEKKFLEDFHSLSEDAQCLYVRMVNRKGRIFRQTDFHYQEIEDKENGFYELQSKGFARRALSSDSHDILGSLKKHEILEILVANNVPVKKSAAKPLLLNLALESQLPLPEDFSSGLIFQERQDELSFLLFLYFGKILEGLSLYTLRDLGIKRMNKYQGEFKPRFKDLQDAESHFFYACLAEDIARAPEISLWPLPQNSESLELRNRILLALAEETEAEADKLHYLKASGLHPAREKEARLLWKLGRRVECETLLKEIIENPWEEEEALFAEDFLERKCGEKRLSALTEALRSARLLQIDEAYFRSPELGVIDHLREEGWSAYHTENHIWNLFFGLLFWEEIFCAPQAGFHNSFELLPADLLNGNFFENHKDSLKIKFQLLEKPEDTQRYLISMAEKYVEDQLGIFSWDDESLTLLLKAVQLIPVSAQQLVLETMAKSYTQYSSGFPDLIAFKDDRVKFIEVKATGDSLKQSQMKMMNLLRSAGIVVDILRVNYFLNPEQIYTVVDLETTGGRSDWDRITEIGAVKIQGGKIIERYQSLINPGRSISKFIQSLTGITNEMVTDAPRFEEVAESFRDFSEGSIFVAHNVNFDYKFLQKEFDRLGERFVRPYICTKAGMKKYYPKLPSYSLKELTLRFDIPLKNHHRALSDAEAAAGLLNLINLKRV